MIKIKTNRSAKFRNESFVHIEKNTGRVRLGEKYLFVDWQTDQFLVVSHCVAVENIHLHELENRHTYLAENCNVETFEEILNLRKIGKTQMLTVAYFTQKNNIKSLNFPPECTNSLKNNSSSSPQKSLKKILPQLDYNLKP